MEISDFLFALICFKYFALASKRTVYVAYNIESNICIYKRRKDLYFGSHLGYSVRSRANGVRFQFEEEESE